MPGAMRILLALACVTLPAASGVRGDSIPPRTMAEYLVDLARHHGLSRRGQQTEADVQHVQTLLRAAARLDPGLADAHLWLYELTALQGDEAAAAKALTALVQADPHHEGAFAQWLRAGVAAQQTAEDRQSWLEAVLARPRPAPMQALVHVELARLELERMAPAAARRHVEQALRLEPACPEAATLALRVLPPDASAGERLAAMLRVLSAYPYATDAAWHAAMLLHERRLVGEAAVFFEYANSVYRRLDPNTPPPGRFLLDRAHNLFARGDFRGAIDCTREAILADVHVGAEAGMYLFYLLQRAGENIEAGRVRDNLADRFAQLRDPNAVPVNEIAQAAWFYCTMTPEAQPQRALMLAKAAAERAPDDPFIQRVLGYSHAINNERQEARAILAPIAPDDPFATSLLVSLMLEEGDQLGALWALESLKRPPAEGPAHDVLEEIKVAISPTTQPTSQPAVELPEIRAALAGFNPEVLRFVAEPGTYLDARIELGSLGPPPGAPWRASFVLTNRGPFPITLGAEGMVNPVFVLTLSMEGDEKRTFPGLLTVSVDRARVLHPGESTRTQTTLDVGPLRSVARRTPQQLQRVAIHAVLGGQRNADGSWAPGPGGQVLRPIYFNRRPVSADTAALRALSGALEGESRTRQVQALEILAELLTERQRAKLGRLNYRPEPVPEQRLRTVLEGLLDNESWEIRARTLDALQLAGMDQGLVAAAERNLEHPHFVVRMLAVRLLARMGPAMEPRFAALAAEDADELVRALAACYRQRWRSTPATTQPTNEE